MEKTFKIFIGIVITMLFVGIFIAINLPKPKMTKYEESELRRLVLRLNSDLPRTIGTIGTLDSITYIDKTVYYNMTVVGDDRIKEVYSKNYDKFKDMLKYTILVMNGQRNMGDTFASLLNDKGLNVAATIFTQDKTSTTWSFSGEELKRFVDSYRISPTTALRTTIDMQIEIANLNLPLSIEDLHNPIKSVALNSLLGDIDETCLPKAVLHEDNNIIFEYSVDEDEFNIENMQKNSNNPETLDAFAASLVEDADFREFIGLIAMSQSNLIITYEGRSSHESVSIRLPYSLLKKYCKVPQSLLS